MERYTASYFRENLPEWKRKKDSLIVRRFFRPLSFFSASWAANHGFGANDISFFSMLIAVLASVLFIPSVRAIQIIGAVLVCFWMLLDCTDGNLARCVKKQPYGEFADGASSYLLIFMLYACLGIAAYRSSGLLFGAGNGVLLFCGVFAGGADSLARLLFQKFENTRLQELAGTKNVGEKKPGGLMKLHDRIDKEIGLNGLLLPGLQICTIFGWLDVFVLFYAFYFAGTLCASLFILIRKVRKAMRSAGERLPDHES